MDDTVSMENEDHIDDELNDYRSDSEPTLEPNPILLVDEPTSDNGNRIDLQEGTHPNKVVHLDDKQITDLYNCLGIPTDESNENYSTWRLNVIHIRGVQEMNTDDVLEFFNDYEPDFIESVNNLSCNVLFADNRAAATALEGLTVALIVDKSQDDLDSIPENTDVIDASEIEYSVPPGNRWKLGRSHDKAKYLLLRFATTADKEMPEAHKDNEPMKQVLNDSIEENEKSFDEEEEQADPEKNDQDADDSLEKSAELGEDDEANSEEAGEGVTRKRGRLVLDDDEDEDENDKKADDSNEDQDSLEKAIGDESEGDAEDGRVKKKRRLIVDDDDGDEEKEDADKDEDEKDEEGKQDNEEDDLAGKSAELEGGDEAEGEGEGDGEEAGESSKIKDPAVPDLSSDEESDDDGKRRSKVPDDFVYDFDLMMAKKKEESYRSRKRKNIDIINDNDDIIADLITQMKQSADEDFELNKNRKAATCKLRLLPVVETQLRKIDLRESFLDAGVLGVITDWLTPLPDRSLPNLQVRECMLKLLGEFNIMDVERLKASGIGKAVMYLYKHPKETKDNKKRAGVLISSWSRPIFSLDSDFHTMSKEEREQRDFDHMNKLSENKRGRTEPKTPPSSSRKTQPESEKTLRPGDKGWIPRARVPAPSTRDYVVRPKSNVDSEMSRSGSKKAITRLDKHLRNFREKKKLMKTQRAVPISIEGRRMTL